MSCLEASSMDMNVPLKPEVDVIVQKLQANTEEKMQTDTRQEDARSYWRG